MRGWQEPDSHIADRKKAYIYCTKTRNCLWQLISYSTYLWFPNIKIIEPFSAGYHKKKAVFSDSLFLFKTIVTLSSVAGVLCNIRIHINFI